MIISQLYNLCCHEKSEQSQAKRTRQSYISRREKLRRSLGADPPTLWRLHYFFPKAHIFLDIFWSKFMRKNTFLYG